MIIMIIYNIIYNIILYVYFFSLVLFYSIRIVFLLGAFLFGWASPITSCIVCIW